MREIKLIQGSICKKFILPPDFESLINLACSSFLLLRDTFTFNYTDEEGDRINIANQFDYEQVLKIYEKHFNEGESKTNNNLFTPDTKKNMLKIYIEKITPKNSETINTPNSPITESMLMFNSNVEHMEEEINIHNLQAEHQELKTALKNMIKTEIDENIEEMKTKLMTAVDAKLGLILAQMLPVNPPNNPSQVVKKKKSSKSLSHNLIPKKKKEIIQSSHGVINLNLGSSPGSKSDNQFNVKEIEKEVKICRKCGHKISSSDFYYNCFYCEDFYFCFNCEKEEDSHEGQNPLSHFQTFGNKHILMKIKHPDREHFESLQNLKKLKRLYQSKKKIITDRDKYLITGAHREEIEEATQEINTISQINNFQPILAFNNLTERIIIEIENQNEESSMVNNNHDFYTFSINFVNLSRQEIKRNSYIECIFDQSDIFGNKIYLEEIIKGYEEFTLRMMFYNFKNKPSGFYTSKWRLVLESSENPKMNASLINFVFYIKQMNSVENDIYNIDVLRAHKDKRSNSFGGNKEKSKEREEKKEKEKCKFPDLFSEIIKKHGQKENK